MRSTHAGGCARAQARSAQYSTEALQRDLQSAEANLAQAKADYQRAQGNQGAGIIAVAELERARTTLATAEAAVQATRQRIEQAIVIDLCLADGRVRTGRQRFA